MPWARRYKWGGRTALRGQTEGGDPGPGLAEGSRALFGCVRILARTLFKKKSHMHEVLMKSICKIFLGMSVIFYDESNDGN